MNAAGHSLAAGEWQGRIFLTREAEGHYRIVNDPASALSAAQSATAADQARAASVTAKSQSETARDQSVTAKNQSETAQQGSETARDQSVTAKDQSETARNESVTARNESVAAKESSGQSAVSAASSASSSAGSASAASGHASAANTSKNEAATSAGTATTQADRAAREANRAEAAANNIDMPVTYLPQTPTAAQQAQARQNMGVENTTAATVAAQVNTLSASGLPLDNDAFFMTRGSSPLKVYWQTIRNWLVNRANHTGTQAMNRIAGLADALTALTNSTYALENNKQDNLGYTPVNKDGGTMDADPTVPLGVATKQYVDKPRIYALFNGGGSMSNSAGVSSVSKHGAGWFQVNFSAPMRLEEYPVSVAVGGAAVSTTGRVATIATDEMTSAGFRYLVRTDAGTQFDSSYNSVVA